MQELVSHFGTQQAAADALGVSQCTVSQWVNKGHGMSAINAMRAERATEGAVRAEWLCPGLSAVS